jgi:hypothetical protein
VAGQEVLDHDVGRGHQPRDDGAAGRPAEVQRERPTVPVDREEVRGVRAVERRPPAPGVVPQTGSLHLQDVGAEVGQHGAAEGPGQDPREVEHPYAAQRTRRAALPASRARSRAPASAGIEAPRHRDRLCEKWTNALGRATGERRSPCNGLRHARGGRMRGRTDCCAHSCSDRWRRAGGATERRTAVVNWYIGNEGWLPDVIEAATRQADGARPQSSRALPTNARTAARAARAPPGRPRRLHRPHRHGRRLDGRVRQAGWITPFEDGELENVGSADKVLKGPFQSAQFDDQQYGAPLNSNTRLLCTARACSVTGPSRDVGRAARHRRGARREGPGDGKRAESLVVFFNARGERRRLAGEARRRRHDRARPAGGADEEGRWRS